MPPVFYFLPPSSGCFPENGLLVSPLTSSQGCPYPDLHHHHPVEQRGRGKGRRKRGGGRGKGRREGRRGRGG